MAPILKYTEEQMNKAIFAVKVNGYSKLKAARVYGVPKSTLWDKVTGKTPIKRKMGGNMVLTIEEELQLVQ